MARSLTVAYGDTASATGPITDADIPSGTSKLLRLHNFHQADISVLAQIDPSAQCRKRSEKLRPNFKQNPPGFDDLQGRG